MPTSLDRLFDPVPHARLLGNGRYTVLFSGAGTGYSAWNGLSLTAWAGDRTEDADGLFVYLRDLDRGTLWSIGHQPVERPAERYEAVSSPGSVTISRLDDGIESSLDVCVVPAADVEVRRLRLRNASRRRRRIEVTSYAEVVLADPGAHAAHPAFSKLFVETERAAEGVLLARRRPRSATEPPAWMLHALAGEGGVQHETDRARFLGRGRTTAAPLALGSRGRLSGTTGSVLDPVFSLRRVVELPAGGEAELVCLLGAASTREEALALGTRHAPPPAAAAALEAAANEERGLLRRLDLSGAEADQLHELLGAILYRHPALRPATETRPLTGGELAGLGLSAARRFIVVEDDEPGPILKAPAYWRARGVDIGVLVIGDPALAGEGVVARRRDEITRAERDVIDAYTLAVVSGPLDRLLAGAPEERAATLARAAARPSRARRRTAKLRFENGHGGFTRDGREYVIRLGPGSPPPPMPWVNVVANERFGFLVSERGAGYTWSRNSRENRLTPWYNDPIADPHGEALYLRDEDRRTFWSPLPGPVPPAAPCEVRHGFGYTRCTQAIEGLEQEVCLFVPREDPLKIVRVRLRNRGRRERRVSVFSFFRLVLGVLPSTAGPVVTELDTTSGALLAVNPQNGDFTDGVVFAAAVAPKGARTRHTGDRAAFVGRNGSVGRPAAVCEAATLDGRTGPGLDPCAAFQVTMRVPAGGAVECAFLLGEVTDRAAARALVARYRRRGALDRALAEVRGFWMDTLSAVEVKTPSPALDVMVNGWLVYQNMSCRLWGRSAFYQSGGAFGFRDQLQDAAALVHVRPGLTRAQILLHAAHQFVEGDVLHWWHPPSGRGTRTRFSDDLVWLPYVTAFYLQATGDWSVLGEVAGFVTARALAPGEDEAYLLPRVSDETADLYAHCCRALDRSLTRGAHGLPLMGTGDWNDGMNRVGREGRGESVWLGFFLYAVLGDFIPICERRADTMRVQRYTEYRAGLRQALEDAGWDGAWYRRAYYDDGTPLGSAKNDECRIDALAQAWSVLSGAAPRARAEQAMDAVERQLVVEKAGIVRLLWPPFDRTPHDPGYIKGYVPGIRENGGQYTHAALWVVRALAELGRRNRAARLLEMLLPTRHTRAAEKVRVYQVEPYVVAADVYGTPPHLGRGGWTWYTGSAGWMYRVALESILGVTVEAGKTLRVRPCIPDGWRGFTVRLRLPDGLTRYEVVVTNRSGSAAAVAAVSVDGEPATVEDGAARIPLRADGRLHRARVTLA